MHLVISNYIVGVFLDPKKTYDTVNPSILINKHEKKGKNWRQNTQMVQKLFVFQRRISLIQRFSF